MQIEEAYRNEVPPRVVAVLNEHGMRAKSLSKVFKDYAAK
jgi:hypothetical protein